jgi:hypothetical protein
MARRKNNFERKGAIMQRRKEKNGLFEQPPGLGLRQSSAAFRAWARLKGARGLAQSKTLSRWRCRSKNLASPRLGVFALKQND